MCYKACSSLEIVLGFVLGEVLSGVASVVWLLVVGVRLLPGHVVVVFADVVASEVTLMIVDERLEVEVW